MAEGALADLLPLTALPAFGRYGAQAGAPGVEAVLVEGLALATLVARAPDVADRARVAFGLALPAGPAVAESEAAGFVGIGPGRWLAVGQGEGAAFEMALSKAFGPAAAVVDQSDAYAVLALAGPRLRDALAKGVAVDLHPSAFGPGRAATTTIAHINATLWQVDAGRFFVAVGTSLVPSFLRWLLISAAEFGVSFTAGRG